MAEKRAEKRTVVVGGHRLLWTGLESVEGTDVFRGALILYYHSRNKSGRNDDPAHDAWYLQSKPQSGNKEPTDKELEAMARDFYERLGSPEMFTPSALAKKYLPKWVPEGCPCMETLKGAVSSDPESESKPEPGDAPPVES